MSNDKLSAHEIVELMLKDRMISGKKAEEFVKVLFSTIEDALIEGEVVKVKGLGTFKSQWNEARKSVDVNSGEEILIEGYYKAAFIPENELRDLINEPFAYLEAVELEALPEKMAEESSDNETIEKTDDLKEPLEPLRVFEEQAEEIKELLNEINALSPKTEDVSDREADEDKQVVVQDQNPENEFFVENIEQIVDLEVIAKTVDDDEVAEVALTDKKEHKKSEFHFDGFDIVRDVSTKFKVLIDSPELLKKSDAETESSEPSKKLVSEINETDKIPLMDEEALKISEDSSSDTIQPVGNELYEENIAIADKEQSEPAETEKVSSTEESDEVNKSELKQHHQPENKQEREPIIEKKLPVNHVSPRKMVAAANESAKNTNYKKQRKEITTRKKSVWLYYLMGLLGLAALSLAAYFFIQGNVIKENYSKYMEFIADSTANALNIKQIEDTLKSKSDSTVTPDSAAFRVDQQPAGTALDSTSNKNIFDAPRSYTEFITTEKMVAGSQLTKFARQYYGHPNFWVYIFEANKNVITDPNNVPLGISVKIPKLDPRLADPKSRESLNYALKLQAEYLK